MSKKLNWKSFEAHEDQEKYVENRFQSLTAEEKIKRFFEVWDMVRALGKSDYKPEGFILKRRS